MRKLFTFCFFIGTIFSAHAQGSSSDWQIQFKKFTLGLLQMIAVTGHDEIMKVCDAEKIAVTKTENKDKTESLSFKMGERKINLVYSKDKKLIYGGSYSEDHKYESADTEGSNLIENNFEGDRKTENWTATEAFGPHTITYYNKKGYPYEFITDSYKFSEHTYIYIFNKEFGSIDKFKNLRE